MEGATTARLTPALQASPHRARPRRRRVAVAFVTVLAVALGWLAFSMLRTPAWYRPLLVPPERQQQVRNNLVAAEQAFTQSLLAGQPFDYHIYQADLNEWLAMRKEIYPHVDELVGSTFRDPFVLITPGRIVLAGLYESAAVSGVISMELEPGFREDAIHLRLVSLRCGSVPLPLAAAGVKLDTPLEFDEGDAWPGSPLMSGNLLDGLRIEKDAWWKNGGVRYEVTNVIAREGRLDISVRPSGRHSDD